MNYLLRYSTICLSNFCLPFACPSDANNSEVSVPIEEILCDMPIDDVLNSLPSLAPVTTLDVREILTYSIIVIGEVTDTGNSVISSSGVVWTTNQSPTIAGTSKVYSCEISLEDLDFKTTYYFIAFGTFYNHLFSRTIL